jgi:hypothetical protein
VGRPCRPRAGGAGDQALSSAEQTVGPSNQRAHQRGKARVNQAPALIRADRHVRNRMGRPPAAPERRQVGDHVRGAEKGGTTAPTAVGMAHLTVQSPAKGQAAKYPMATRRHQGCPTSPEPGSARSASTRSRSVLPTGGSIGSSGAPVILRLWGWHAQRARSRRGRRRPTAGGEYGRAGGEQRSYQRGTDCRAGCVRTVLRAGRMGRMGRGRSGIVPPRFESGSRHQAKVPAPGPGRNPDPHAAACAPSALSASR